MIRANPEVLSYMGQDPVTPVSLLAYMMPEVLSYMGQDPVVYVTLLHTIGVVEDICSINASAQVIGMLPGIILIAPFE